MRLDKYGVAHYDNLIESDLYNQTSINKILKPNLYNGFVDIVTNKTGTIRSTIISGSISGAVIKSLVGQTLCCSYEVSAYGDRYSVEHGETEWNKIRYGIHGVVRGYDSSDNPTQYYPFAQDLTYSGGKKRTYGTWVVPNVDHFGDFTISIQNYDKPASTNDSIWYIKNLKVEVNTFPTCYVLSDYNVYDSANAISSTQFYET